MASILKSFKANAAAAPTDASTYLKAANASGSSSPSLLQSSTLSKLTPYLDYLSLPSLKGASATSTLFTILAIVATVLIYEQVNYRQKKKGLPGAKWTIPVIGAFADSVNPSMEKYMKGWNSGPLSVASVFNM